MFYYVLSFGFFGGFLVFVFCFMGGFKGHVRWPTRPPHLALNPPYLFSFVFGFVNKVEGSGEVARRATSLGPKPSLFVFFCFLSFVLEGRKTAFSPNKGHFCSFFCVTSIVHSLCLSLSPLSIYML